MTPKKIINRKLADVSKKYWDSIPLDVIFEIVRENGGMVVDSDGCGWNGFLCGESATVYMTVIDVKSAKILSLGWYKMPSGRYEITAYIS